MEIEIIKEGKEELEFAIKGERHTFPNLLRSTLLKDSKVVFAAYKLHHPSDEGASFALRTSGKVPKKALADALKEINSDLADFDKEVKKVLK